MRPKPASEDPRTGKLERYGSMSRLRGKALCHRFWKSFRKILVKRYKSRKEKGFKGAGSLRNEDAKGAVVGVDGAK